MGTRPCNAGGAAYLNAADPVDLGAQCQIGAPELWILVALAICRLGARNN